MQNLIFLIIFIFCGKTTVKRYFIVVELEINRKAKTFLSRFDHEI